ncbi:MAG: alpha/beta hydrolase [Chitinophagales bacterium]
MEKLEIKPDESGYSNINGIQLYYEIYGKGKPLVLIHGGGSTIQTTFANAIPLFSKSRKLICIELQAHGRTEDRDNPLSFEQDADDIATLLENLHIEKTSLFGFSNGGMTAIQFAIKYPNKCDKIVAASVILKRNGTFPLFWDFIKNSTLNDILGNIQKCIFSTHTRQTEIIKYASKMC